jgi:alcohol dehydrogenase class IV
VGARYAELARSVGITASNDRNLVLGLVARIERLRAELDMPATVSQAGVDKKEFLASVDKLAETALVDFCTVSNPVDVTVADLAGLLKAVA